MKRSRWFMIPLGLVLAAFVTVCSARSSAQNPVAPDFTLKDLNGAEVSLSDFEGKVLFINFWATWCPPCRAEIPDFIEAYDEYKNSGLAILGISVDRDKEEIVSEFAKRLQMNYPVAMATPELFRDYTPPQAIPTTLVVDGSGKIRYRKVGMMTKRELVDLFLEFK